MQSARFCAPVLALLLAAPAFADAPVTPVPVPHAASTVRVMGLASVQKAPDVAEVDLAVVTRAKTAVAGGQENAQKVARVLAGVKDAIGSKGEVSTIGYSASPQYRQPKDGVVMPAPIIDGYIISNTVRVRLRAVGDAGKIIDVALARGANEVQRLSFGLADGQAAYAEALQLAAKNARAKAEALATSLNLKIYRALSVEDQSGGVQPFLSDARMMKASFRAETPIESGTTEVQANVAITFECR